MNHDHDFFQVGKLSEEQQKKRYSSKKEYFFSPNSGEDLRSDAHQIQIIGGGADEDHTQIIGGDTVKFLGGYIPPGFRYPWLYRLKFVHRLVDLLEITVVAPNGIQKVLTYAALRRQCTPSLHTNIVDL